MMVSRCWFQVVSVLVWGTSLAFEVVSQSPVRGLGRLRATRPVPHENPAFGSSSGEGSFTTDPTFTSTETDGTHYSIRVRPKGLKKGSEEVISKTSSKEPPEWEKNRKAARERRLKNFDSKGQRRRTLLEAQRILREKARKRPSYLPVAKNLTELHKGEWFDGVVRTVKGRGAYVSIGTEMDGFLHKKDISATEWVEDLEEAGIFVGKRLRCCVKAVDPEKRLLSLSAIELESTVTSGTRRVSDLALGQTLRRGRIMKLTAFAAYVDVGVEVPAYLHVTDIGLLPRMKIGARREARVQWEVGALVPECWVTSIDVDKSRFRISTIPPSEREEGVDAVSFDREEGVSSEKSDITTTGFEEEFDAASSFATRDDDDDDDDDDEEFDALRKEYGLR